MKTLTTIISLAGWTLLIFGIGKVVGLSEKRATIVRQVQDVIEESVASGKPFMFQGGRIGVILEHRTKPGNDRAIAYRAVAFIWPEDEEVLPVPVNKFSQYGKEWTRTW